VGLKDEVMAQEPARRACTCATGRTIAGMSEQDAADMREVLADPGITAAAISRALAARGTHIAGPNLARHRKGHCGCPR